MGFTGGAVLLILWAVYRMLLFVRTVRWRRINARILDVAVKTELGVGCPWLELRYQFSDGGDLLEGRDRVPFADIDVAERFARRWPKDEVVIIRIKPSGGDETRLFRIDQK